MSRDMTKTSHATVEVAIESTSPDMTKHAPHAIVKRTINETQHYLKKKKSKQGSNNLGDNCSNRDNVRLLILFKTGQSQHHSSTRVIGILK